MRWDSDIQIFTPEECKELADEFFAHPTKTDENGMPEFYKNSLGVFNLPRSLKHVERLTNVFIKKYPGIVFANSYTRLYQRHSVLKLHTDRKDLDLSLSVCLEDKNNLEWPLNISAKPYNEDDWDLNEDPVEYKKSYVSAYCNLGYGAVVEGRKFPHWRDELLCGESQRALYIFYHWTFPKLPEPSKLVLKYKSAIDISVFKDFITKEECEEIIALAEPKLIKSLVVGNDDGADTPSETRRSMQTFLSKQSTPLIKRLEDRIAKLTQTPVENGEDFQIVRYDINDEYVAHHDFFHTAHPNLRLDQCGQRIATVILYLNTPEAGGATEFAKLGIQVQATQGHALLFTYPNQEQESLHAGLPVKAGVKWIATKWIRERTFV